MIAARYQTDIRCLMALRKGAAVHTKGFRILWTVRADGCVAHPLDRETRDESVVSHTHLEP